MVVCHAFHRLAKFTDVPAFCNRAILMVMNHSRTQRLKPLLDTVPPGFLVDTPWLKARSIDPKSIHDYVARRWLERVVRGVYRRPAPQGTPAGDESWAVLLLSLQRLMNYAVHVGGRDRPRPRRPCALPEPRWDAPRSVLRRGAVLADAGADPHGDRRAPTHPSSATIRSASRSSIPRPERRSTCGAGASRHRLLNAPFSKPSTSCRDTPASTTSTRSSRGWCRCGPTRSRRCSPPAAASRCAGCSSYSRNRHGHGWGKHLDASAIDFGSGPRALVEGGRFHPAYRISVPATLMPAEPRAVDGDA